MSIHDSTRKTNQNVWEIGMMERVQTDKLPKKYTRKLKSILNAFLRKDIPQLVEILLLFDQQNLMITISQTNKNIMLDILPNVEHLLRSKIIGNYKQLLHSRILLVDFKQSGVLDCPSDYILFIGKNSECISELFNNPNADKDATVQISSIELSKKLYQKIKELQKKR